MAVHSESPLVRKKSVFLLPDSQHLRIPLVWFFYAGLNTVITFGCPSVLLKLLRLKSYWKVYESLIMMLGTVIFAPTIYFLHFFLNQDLWAAFLYLVNITFLGPVVHSSAGLFFKLSSGVFWENKNVQHLTGP